MDDKCSYCGLIVKARHILSYVSLVYLLVTTVSAKPDGPPTSACRSMYPGTEQGAFFRIGHTAQAQNEMYNGKKSPFGIHIYHKELYYRPNEDIPFGIVAHQKTGAARYKGLLLQARAVKCASKDRSVIEVEDKPIGTFYVKGTSKESLLTPMTCSGTADNSLSHFSPQWKVNETAFWTAPGPGFEGHIIFTATIVQDVRIFWTHVYSRILRDERLGEPYVCAAICLQKNLLLVTGLSLIVFFFNRKNS